jgi:CBS-domain-containing membrane protein
MMRRLTSAILSSQMMKRKQHTSEIRRKRGVRGTTSRNLMTMNSNHNKGDEVAVEVTSGIAVEDRIVVVEEDGKTLMAVDL